MDILGECAFGEFVEVEAGDFEECLFFEGSEEDGFVDAVEEFGSEEASEFVGDLVGWEGLFVGGLEADGFALFLEAISEEIGGHDKDGVATVDGAAYGVGEAAFFEELEEEIEDFGVSFFDFIEEDDAVGSMVKLCEDLAFFAVADVSGGSADQAGGAVFFSIFGHIKANQGSFLSEKLASEGATKLGFSDSAGAEEEHNGGGSLGAFEASASELDGLGDGGNGGRLAEYASAESVLEAE